MTVLIDRRGRTRRYVRSTSMALNSPRFLIVEGDPLISGRIFEVLRELEFNDIAHASSGQEAISLVDRYLPMVALIGARVTGPMQDIEIAKLLLERGVSCIFPFRHMARPDPSDGRGTFQFRPVNLS